MGDSYGMSPWCYTQHFLSRTRPHPWSGDAGSSSSAGTGGVGFRDAGSESPSSPAGSEDGECGEEVIVRRYTDVALCILIKNKFFPGISSGVLSKGCMALAQAINVSLDTGRKSKEYVRAWSLAKSSLGPCAQDVMRAVVCDSEISLMVRAVMIE